MSVLRNKRTNGHSAGNGNGGDNWLENNEKLFSPFNVACGLASILIFVIGTIIQMYTPRYPELNNLVQQCVEKVNLSIYDCREAVIDFDKRSHRSGDLNLWLILSELLRSSGIAIILSIIISVTLERQSRSRFTSALATKTKELSLSVFTGMFNRRHPPALLSVVKSQILERDLIRESLSVTYTLSLWEPPANCTRLQGQCFVKVDVLLSSTVRNVSTVTSGSAGIATVPIGLALPNPMLDELKPFVRVNEVVVNGEAVGDDLIQTQNQSLQTDLARDGEEDVSVSFGERNISPDETLSVSANYSMMKEMEDTEVFRTLQITQSLTLTVHDNTGKGLVVRAKSIHSRSLEKMASSSATTQWRLPDILLPQQGIIVWWKKRLLTPPTQISNMAAIGCESGTQTAI
jgi:hypothetical protein